MEKVKAIIFDFGGVLLDLNITNTEISMAKLLGIEVDQLYEPKYREITLALEKGEIFPEAFIHSIQSMCDPVPSAKAVVDAWNAMLCGWQLDKFELLNELKKDYKLYLLSNTNQIHLDYVMWELATKYNISNFEEQFFDKCFYSHRMHAWKPEIGIYKQVEDYINMKHEEFIFIDDNENNVDAAVKLGWQAYLHPTNKDLRKTLKKHRNKVS